MLLNKNYFSLQAPQIMGICNVTIDSFSDGGKSFKTQDAIKNIDWKPKSNLIYKELLNTYNKLL